MLAYSSCSRAVNWRHVRTHVPRGCRVIMGDPYRCKKRRVDDPDSPVRATMDTPEIILQHNSGPSFKVPGLLLTDHHFKVPLDHSGEVDGEIDLFVREVVAPNHTRRHHPYLLYLQGGPGFESPRPTENSAWLKAATTSFRVILMDQRGTGLSSQLSAKSIAKLGTPQQQADYLKFFRADSIVRDAEIVRKSLVPKENQGGRWSILGQSFGGFCCMTYLSFAPEGLIECLMTGGIPPLINEPCSAPSVYRSLMQRVLWQNKKYYSRFPEDVALVQEIVRYLSSQPEGGVRLPSGTLLTPRAFQYLGLSGLGTGGGLERLHYIIESFFDRDREISPSFIKQFEMWMPWDTNPLFALLHEAIYCQEAASEWAAHKIRETEFKDQCDPLLALKEGRLVMFLGEMIFPSLFQDFASLRPVKEVAHILAAKKDWPLLYDLTVLQHNKIPVAAATYCEDMYVDFNLAQKTSAFVKNMRQWITNEYKHSGIRDDGARIFDRLLNMSRDVILIE